ncbi:MAG TPA: DUF971 domain-containing protein [Chthoniobacterales bacterium]
MAHAPIPAPRLQLIGTELAVAWRDGTESYFPLEFLRRACPCAACGGEPDVLGRIIRPRQELTEKSFQLAGYEFVGGYGWQPAWGDGHRSGIYSWDFLKRLEEGMAGK